MNHIYCVYIFRKKFNNYSIYYSDGKYIEESYEIPNADYDKFECSKLTNKKINEQLNNGITLKEILIDYSKNLKIWRDELLNSKHSQKVLIFLIHT